MRIATPEHNLDLQEEGTPGDRPSLLRRRVALRSRPWPVRCLPVVAALLLWSVACSDQRGERPVLSEAAGEPLPQGAQARSLLGETFFPPPLPDDLEESRRADLAEARRALEADSSDAEAWIWVGRRQAYLGEYRAAIETFTRGIERFPEDPRFYRHRGHRYLTVRELERARADLERGLELARGHPDQVEPDGLPNALGVPLSTLHFNLWYHLGLARYVEGDWAGAAEAWTACMEVSGNPDLRVATSYWLNLTLRRLGRDDEAAALLERLPEPDEVIENDAYLSLLRLFLGDDAEADVLEGRDPASLGGATLGYGVAAHHLLQGREDAGRALLQRVLEAPEQWPTFGYLAAEAEVARRGW
ncbi:MAG: tetratricopeptide repeat protein [bacterium]